jgi:hypothetical protein
MLREWAITLIHALLCLAMVLGVVFSKTAISKGAVLAILMLLFIGIRLFGTCIMDLVEECDNKPVLADIGAAMIIKDYKNISKYEYEQAAVGSLLIVHLIKIFVLSVYPVDTLF